jgi:hypothetical protein
MFRASLWLIAFSLVHALHAQQTGFTEPIQAFTFDSPTRTIRALTGSLGAALFGPALIKQVDFATVAPRENYGIAFRRGEALFVSGLGSSQLSTQVLQIGSSVPDRAAWSDDGSVVILGSQSANWIQVYSGFPGSVSTGTQVSVLGSLSAIAADPHGQRIVIGIAGNSGGVYQLGTDQSFSQLLQVSCPISLSFSADGGTLFILDQATNQVFQLTLSNSAVQAWPAGVEDAIAIRTATDTLGENVLYVAGRSSHLLLSVDQATHQTITSAVLSFVPTIIDPLGATGFSLTRRSISSDILWTFVHTPQPTIYFVPAMSDQPLPRETSRP